MAKSRILYLVDHCLTPSENVPNSGILCEGEQILAIGGASAFAREPGLEIIKLDGAYAVPGFIDSHIHGSGGFDSTAAYEEGADIDKMCKTLASHGVTSFFPTIVSAPFPNMIKAVAALAKMVDDEHDGADPEGIHVEGPFLCKAKSGSQVESHIVPIDLAFAKELIAAGSGRIKLMTFAPELPGSDKLIELLLENGIIPSMGHSLAGEQDAVRAIDAGARRVTHIFNGMPQLHQREASLTTVALEDNRVSVEIIVDGYHIHPRMVDLVSRLKPKDKVIGVSDAVQATGLKAEGTFHLGDSTISVKDGVVTTDKGVIAGTTMTLESAWHHLRTYAKMPATLAASCFTSNPATDLGLITRGELKPGRRADISFFDCVTNKTRMTVIKGRICYYADSNVPGEANNGAS